MNRKGPQMRISKAVLLGAIAALGMMASPARAQVTVPGQPIIPLGYCQLSTLSASVLLSSCAGGIPSGSTIALIQAEAQAIRYRDDGTAPTAAVGLPVAAAGSFLYSGPLNRLRFIEQTSGAKLNVLFYR